MEETGTNSAYHCAFCYKRGDEVEQLIAGPKAEAFICDECVELYYEIVQENRQSKQQNGNSSEAKP